VTRENGTWRERRASRKDMVITRTSPDGRTAFQLRDYFSDLLKPNERVVASLSSGRICASTALAISSKPPFGKAADGARAAAHAVRRKSRLFI